MKRKIISSLLAAIVFVAVFSFSACTPKKIDVETLSDIWVDWSSFNAFAVKGSDLEYMSVWVNGTHDGKQVRVARGDGETTGFALKVNGEIAENGKYLFENAGAYEISVVLNDFTDSFYLNVGEERAYHMYASRVYLKTDYRLCEMLSDTDLTGAYVGIQEFGAHSASISLDGDFVLETLDGKTKVTQKGKNAVRLRYTGSKYASVSDFVYNINVK